MKRRVMQFAAAVSLLMCVVTLALWVRSYWRRDDLRVFPSTQRYWLLRSAEGR